MSQTQCKLIAHSVGGTGVKGGGDKGRSEGWLKGLASLWAVYTLCICMRVYFAVRNVI